MLWRHVKRKFCIKTHTWSVWHQKQVSHAGKSNYISQYMYNMPWVVNTTCKPFYAFTNIFMILCLLNRFAKFTSIRQYTSKIAMQLQIFCVLKSACVGEMLYIDKLIAVPTLDWSHTTSTCLLTSQWIDQTAREPTLIRISLEQIWITK